MRLPKACASVIAPGWQTLDFIDIQIIVRRKHFSPDGTPNGNLFLIEQESKTGSRRMASRQVVTGQQILLRVLQTRDSILQLRLKIASDACAFQGF
ncbi:hypothetical protein D3C78_1505400 [compost metagenome]